MTLPERADLFAVTCLWMDELRWENDRLIRHRDPLGSAEVLHRSPIMDVPSSSRPDGLVMMLGVVFAMILMKEVKPLCWMFHRYGGQSAVGFALFDRL
jgi:hypothetical protein